MLRKSLILALIIFSGYSLAIAQDAPPKPKPQVDLYRALVDGGMSGGSFLGVQPRDVSKDNMAQFGLREVRGVAVEKVVENSPAAQAGLQKNDVIIRFNGEDVSSVRKLTRLISEVAPDHAAKITVLRNGSEMAFDVTVGKREIPQLFDGNFKIENFPRIAVRPEIPDFPKEVSPQLKAMKPDSPQGFVWSTGANRQLGISVTSLTKQLGDFFGAPDGKGLLINSVREDSPAFRAGLRAGDVIVEIQGNEVKDSFDLIRTLNDTKEADVRLTIIRDKNRNMISVTPEPASGEVFRFGDRENLLKEFPEFKLQTTVPQVRIAPFNFEFNNAPKILE